MPIKVIAERFPDRYKHREEKLREINKVIYSIVSSKHVHSLTKNERGFKRIKINTIINDPKDQSTSPIRKHSKGKMLSHAYIKKDIDTVQLTPECVKIKGIIPPSLYQHKLIRMKNTNIGSFCDFGSFIRNSRKIINNTRWPMENIATDTNEYETRLSLDRDSDSNKSENSLDHLSISNAGYPLRVLKDIKRIAIDPIK